MKNILKIINEEISKFDFLGSDAQGKEDDINNLLGNEDFQKQFICDSLTKPEKIKIGIYDSKIGGNWEEDSDVASNLSIEYILDIEYKYDLNEESIKFELNLNSDGVSINKVDNYNAGNRENYEEPSGNAWFNRFDWSDINVAIFTIDGDEIDFIALKKAPQRIQTLFIRNYVEEFINDYTGLEIGTEEMKDKIQNTSYCNYRYNGKILTL